MTPLRVLIADNESIIRMDLREMLTGAGYEIAGEAKDGKSAVELAKKRNPDLVIMDVRMPVMDGITAARKISDEKPVLLLTAFSDIETIERAKDSGVLAYLVKPASEAQLFAAMEIAISRWNEMKALETELSDAKDSLETRKLIERAKGILMKAHGLSESDAYKKMQRYSMANGKPMKEIAGAVIRAATKKKGGA